MWFENWLSNAGFDELDEKINELSSKDELSNESSDFLIQKLEEKKIDMQLKNYESEEMEDLIDLHQEFYRIKKRYEIEKKLLTENTKKKLDKAFNEIKASEIWKINLKSLKSELQDEKTKVKDTVFWWEMWTYRDFIENTVNIKSYIPESFIETNLVKLFYTKLTIKYLNFLEKKYNNNYSIISTLKNTEKGFTIPKNEIINIIKEVFIENENELKNFKSNLEIKILWNIESVVMEDIKSDLIIESKLNEIRRRNKEREEELSEKKSILNELIKIKSEQKEILINISKNTYLFWNEDPETLKAKFIKSLIQTWSLTKKEVTSIVKNEIWFNLSVFSKSIKNDHKLKELVPGKDNTQIDSKEAKKILKSLIMSINRLKKIEEKALKYLKIKKWQSNFDIKFTKQAIENWDISVSELLRISEYKTFNSSWIGQEKFRRFNYLEFIENYWLSEKTKEFLEEMLLNWMLGEVIPVKDWEIILSKSYINKYKKEILKNLETFNKIIIWIECDWRNIDNNRWSWAEWYFQFHTWNWVETKEEKNHWFNSFETNLRKAYKYYANITDEDINVLNVIMPGPWWKLRRISEIDNKYKLKNVPEWIIEAYNTPWFSPKFLTAEQQNELFLISAFENKTKIEDKKTAKEYIWLALMWNIEWIEKYYKVFHHTAVDAPTIERINKFKKIYWNTLWVWDKDGFRKIIRAKNKKTII